MAARLKKTYELKIFKNGGSRAVRVPAELGLDSEVLYLRTTETEGEFILSATPPSGGLHAWLQRWGDTKFDDSEWQDLIEREPNNELDERDRFGEALDSK